MGHSPQSLMFNWVRQQNERQKFKGINHTLLSLPNSILIQYACIWVITFKIVPILYHF